MQKAFDAKQIYVSNRPDGTIMHATMQVGDSMVILPEATEQTELNVDWYSY
ncbi:MAG: hypothetical protein ABIT08_06410 [Bacteroidia bacterium]